MPTPILDDRSFQQLRDELVRRIPVYAPEWTDHNPSDPGITLIELFAFLGENLLFRFNQIPDATRLEFLRLLRIPLRPAAAAGGIVAMTTRDPSGTLVPRGTAAKAGKVAFETDDEVHVWPLSVRAMAKAAAEAPDPEDKEAWDFLVRARDARRLAADEEAVYYTTATVPTDPSAPGALPVDVREAVDGSLWIAAIGAKEADPTKLGGAIVNLGMVLDEQVTGADDVQACPAGAAAPPSPSLRWQVSTGHLDPGGAPRYQTVAVVGDTTGGLTRQGVVRLQLPGSPSDIGPFVLADPDLRGTGDLPPDLDDEAAKGLLFWLRAFRPGADAPIGRILWVGANAATVVQSRKAQPEFVGTGTGDADQRHQLVNGPVIQGSLALEVEEEPGRWTRWTAVDDLQASREDDRHYVVDLEAGEVRFGNGITGRAPQIGERIRAVEYRYGGGPEGNLAPAAISQLEGFASVKVANPLPTRGGAAAETIAEGLERIPGEFRRHDRAVAPDDFRELALATPGASVGRAESLPLYHAPTGRDGAAGVVSVVVWPREDPKRPSAPMPDRTLLRAVCSWLDARRLVTTELYVIPPAYVKVAVAVGVAVKPGFGVEAVRHWVEQVLRQYLAPLPPYGPDGNGWPLLRRVYGPELEAAALQVEGVEFLEGLAVARLADDGVTWNEGPVELRHEEVPELAVITVVEGAPLPLGVSPSPPQPPRTPIPIPVVREVC
jgi:hypothetical protein